MNPDRNSSEEIAKRSNLEDPIVMYLIVRESLGMSIGKTATQTGHTVGMLYAKLNNLSLQIESHIDPVYGPSKDFELIHKNLLDTYNVWEKWISSSFRKVVLRADDKEWDKLKTTFPNCVVVVDAGLTELQPGTETCIRALAYPEEQSA